MTVFIISSDKSWDRLQSWLIHPFSDLSWPSLFPTPPRPIFMFSYVGCQVQSNSKHHNQKTVTSQKTVISDFAFIKMGRYFWKSPNRCCFKFLCSNFITSPFLKQFFCRENKTTLPGLEWSRFPLKLVSNLASLKDVSIWRKINKLGFSQHKRKGEVTVKFARQ